MAVNGSLSVVVNAPVAQVLDFLRDIDNQHTWFPGNEVSQVVERDANGLPSKARLVNDVKVAKDDFTLDYEHTDSGFSWRLTAPTRVQKMQEGSWRLADKGGQTEATMSLALDTSLPLPGFVQKKTLNDTLKGATSALAKQF
jgi:ribosome-associated toxin RatA of RatAB toxin-antitoxin module